MMGTRGVPARYGGFETAIEEIGRRRAAKGHQVTVYCRQPADDEEPLPSEHLGMDLVTLPAARRKALETLSHTTLSAAHAVTREHHDVVFLFNAANALLVPVLHARRLPVAVHVDGLEWRRSKWSGGGQRYYRSAEALSVRWADALIADAQGIADYYLDEFGATTELIAYGAPILEDLDVDRLAPRDMEPRGFDLLVRGYAASDAALPLVVVGGAPYSDGYTESIQQVADGDPRIRVLGSVWDQVQLDQLYGHARLYLHGHSVGGTNPSLLRAMGAGAAVSAFDVGFNAEVLGDDDWCFADEAGVRRAVEAAEADGAGFAAYGDEVRTRAAERYRWDEVAEGYEELGRRLAGGWTRRGEVDGRRRNHPRWARDTEPAAAGSRGGQR